MKKSKISFLFVILLGLMFSPLFFGCVKSVKINLAQPSDVAYQLDDETGKELLVTEYNKYASSYIFGISESYDGEDTSGFLRYEVPATYSVEYNGNQVEIAHNFLDVTNVFKNARTYYFYAQYKGSDTFVDSEISPVRSVSITQKLATPFLSLVSGNLSWTAINNATNYSVYALINGENQFVATTASSEYDVSNFIETKINQGLNSEIKFFVYCNSSQNYTRSADSNYVSYSAHLYLRAPSNVAISTTTPKKLSWTAVKNATVYKVCINDLIFVDVDSTKYTVQNGKICFDVNQYYDDLGLGDYEFKVKANAYGNFIESSYSSIVRDTYTQELETPQNLRCIDNFGNVEITWDVVENAKTYALEFSDVKNAYKIKRYNPTGNNGVSGTIIHNSVTLTYSELGILSISTLKNSNFVVRVKAEGYNYYTDSQYAYDKTVISKNEILLTPTLVNNESSNLLTWSEIADAIKYEILVEHNNTISQYYTTATSFDYAEYITEVGRYTFKCKAIASDDVYNSSYSNQVEKDIVQQLSKPTLNSVDVDGSYFVLDYICDSRGQSNSIYVNGTLVDDDLVSSNPKILIESISDLAVDNQLEFVIKTNGYDFWTDSEYSNSYSVCTKLETPEITVSGNTLSWNGAEYASNYVLLLDDQSYELDANSTQLNLVQYVGSNQARQIILQATNQYLVDSELSQSVIYNRATRNLNGYTDRYFYYGQTYDYYITSQDEFDDLIRYAFHNRLQLINAYIDYDSSVNIHDKLKSALDVTVCGTHNYSYEITNAYVSKGETKITFEHKSMSEPPTYTSSYTQYDGGMVYCGQGTRDASHVFACDNYVVSQDVYTTDGLLCAIQNKAKPNFVQKNSVSETVYNKAKEILIEICDDDMTDYQKALAIHDYLVTHISYDTYGWQNISIDDYLGYFHFIEGALLTNLAVCDGYSKSFALLCNMEGIGCVVINGATDKENPKTTGHAWNKIYLDYNNDGEKEWLAVDCTHDDAKKTGTNIEYLMHEHFMIPDSYIADRVEDLDYPETTINDEAFYSVLKIENQTLKIDSTSKALIFRDYLRNKSDDVKIEFIVSKNLYSTLASYIDEAFGYKYNSDFYLCYA